MSRSSHPRRAGDDDGSSDGDTVKIGPEDVSNYNPDNILPESPGNIKKIRQWLKPTQYDIAGGEYRKHLDSHLEGTGSWLASSDAYRQWLQSNVDGLLWIKGIPGSGKSVHAANIIHALGQANPTCPVLFFFFRQIIVANHDPQALVRDWMDQLLDYSPPLQKTLIKHVNQRSDLSTHSSTSLLGDLKNAILMLPDKVFCVVDALDEMDSGNEIFLEELASLGLWRPDFVKVLVTSRPVPKVEVTLRKKPALMIRLEENLVDRDISKFVHTTLQSSQIPQDKWETITDAVPGRANGLFLYARLAMDAFLRPDADIDSVLSQLPVDLNMLYTGLLDSHKAQSGVSDQVQHLILQAITHCVRPLRLIELAEVIRILDPDGKFLDLKTAKELVRRACGPLLEVLPDETVSVIHHSFTEYLNGSTRMSDSTGYPILQPGATHAKLAAACLRYLLNSGSLERLRYLRMKKLEAEESGDLDPKHRPWIATAESLTTMRTDFPFYEYATRSWDAHVRASEATSHPQGEIEDLLTRLFNHSAMTKCWIHLRWERTAIRSATEFTLLHVSAAAGLVSYTSLMLQSPEAHVDKPDNDGRTPLWWAASEGHAAAVKLLIDAGANPDQDDQNGLKPLHKAAKGNQVSVMRLLLDANVDPNTKRTKENSHPGRARGRRTKGDTALLYACNGGHVEAVDVLLSAVDLHHATQALGWAVDSSQARVVKYILRYPNIDLNATYGTSTLLYKACRNRDVETVEVLLQAGADPNRSPSAVDLKGDTSTDPTGLVSAGQTPLFALCERYSSGMKEEEARLDSIYKLLIDAGADVNHLSASGKSVLHDAAKQSQFISKALLEAGVSANIKTRRGNTALHNCSPPIVSLLIERGKADIDAMNDEKQTPLSLALASGGTEKALRLIEHGAQVNLVRMPGPEFENSGPLHRLLSGVGAYNVSTELVEKLLEKGADPNQRNKNGETPAMVAPSSNPASIRYQLLNAGSDVNAKDFHGRTMLFNAAAGLYRNPVGTTSEQGEITKLIEYGALVSARDLRGRTCLHAAVGALRTGLYMAKGVHSLKQGLKFLVELGIDPRATDKEGNTLLHELAQASGAGETPIWEYLMEAYGLDINQENDAGRNPLHMLCKLGNGLEAHLSEEVSQRPLELLLQKSKDIDTRDDVGATALHLAATHSELLVKRLLEAGADPLATTYQGMNILHLAARAQQPNIIGLALSELRRYHVRSATGEAGKGLLSPALEDSEVQGQSSAGQMLDGVNEYDMSGKTPLYYAVRSGQPESVALLLEAGAETGLALQACLDFESEYSYVNMAASKYSNDRDVLLDKPTPGPQTAHWKDLGPHTARLEEILEMLAGYGVDFTSLRRTETRPAKSSLISKAASSASGSSSSLSHSGYAAFCLSEVLRTKGLKRAEEMRLPFDVKLVTVAFDPPLSGEADEFPIVRANEDHSSEFMEFMRNRRYKLVEELARRGADFLTEDDTTYSVSNFKSLVQNGFTALARSIGDIIAAKALDDGTWHAFGNRERAGLWYANRDAAIAQEGIAKGRIPEPLLHAAVKRKEPNLETMKLLVSHFGVDINEPTFEAEGDSREEAADETPLHYLAHGRHWWHVYQALPYLLSLPGIDVNARTTWSEATPLHFAISDDPKYFRGQNTVYSLDAARVLLENGADVDAVANYRGKSYSCLDLATGNPSMLKLLLDHRATMTPAAVNFAAKEGDIDTLRLFLSAGHDPNAIQTITSLDAVSGGSHREGYRQELALHAAVEPLDWRHSRAVGERGTTRNRNKVLRLLLDHGADPMLKFIMDHGRGSRRNGSYVRKADHRPTITVPENRREGTVFHEIVNRSDATYLPTLLNAGADINAQDAHGMTILHLLAVEGKDIYMPWWGIGEKENSYGKDNSQLSPWDAGMAKPTVLGHLVSQGADVTCRDHLDRNLLMALLSSTNEYSTPEDREEAITMIIDLAPELVNQADRDGATPLIYALRNIMRLRSGEKSIRHIFHLLDSGADLYCKTKEGDGLLHILSKRLYPEYHSLFRELVKRGLDLNERNNAGRTPLFVFAERKKILIREKSGAMNDEGGSLDMLRELGADFSVKDNDGMGLLHVAATGDYTRFSELMAEGLDPLDEDKLHQTAVDKAVASSNKAVLTLFEKPDSK